MQGSPRGGVLRVKFQIDVEHLQLSFQAEPGGRAFLLAAERSQIVTCGIDAEVPCRTPCSAAPSLVLSSEELVYRFSLRCYA